MSTKKLSIFLVFLFLGITITDAYSQRRPRNRSERTQERSEERQRDRRSSRDVETVTLKDKLAWDIYVGNIGFNQGFQISTKFGAGYKLTDPFTLGLGFKNQLFFRNNVGVNDETIFDYAFFPYARYRFGENFYIKAEYNWFTRDGGRNGDDISFSFPMLGAGYASGFGPWKIGIELMFIVVDPLIEVSGGVLEGSDLYTLIEYNVSFLYNF